MNKIVVKIANQEYSITGDEEKDYILSLASHVDEQIRLAQNKAPRVNNITPVILASINITDQLFKERRKIKELTDASLNPAGDTDISTISYDSLIDEQNETIEKLYERIQNLDNILAEKNEQIAEANNKLQALEKENTELNKLLNEFQSDMHQLQFDLTVIKKDEQ